MKADNPILFPVSTSTTSHSMPKLADNEGSNAETKEDRQFVTALARGLDILRCFTASRIELGTMEIANLTGLPQPTVWRLCHTLVKCGFLAPSQTSDKLRIGMPVLGLGFAALSMMGFDEIVRQEMQQLASDFHGAVSLATPHRLEMLIVQRAHGDGVLLVNLHVGSRLPIATSSFGWAYIASLPKQERGALFKQLAVAHKSEWLQLEKHILAAVAKYEESGYVINSGHFHREINAIAVPIVDEDSKETKVINCGGPSVVVTVEQLENEIAPRLLELANTIRASNVASRAAGQPRIR
jgi:DNA-binding IclR family transcriptional regulator